MYLCEYANTRLLVVTGIGEWKGWEGKGREKMKKETESRQRSKNVEKATDFSMKMETSFLVYFVAWVSW